MAWQIKYLRSARKDISKLDADARRRIRHFIEERIPSRDDPRQLGKPLKSNKYRLWRYRVGNYRIICELRDDELIVLVVRIDHRKDVDG